MKSLSTHISKCVLTLGLVLTMSGCISTVVGAVVDTTIAVVKVPFKVGGAVIDIVTPDKKNDLVDQLEEGNTANGIDIDSDEAAILMESEVLQ